MEQSAMRGLLAAAVAGLLGAGVPAVADEFCPQRRQRIEELEARIEALGVRPASHDLSLVAEALLSDAAGRSQLLANSGGFNAGYDNGFFIRSEDGSFVMKPGAHFQFRHVSNYRDDTNDWTTGAEIRRMRFMLEGNAFSPNLSYSFLWDFPRTGAVPNLYNAFVTWRFEDTPWSVRVGQFKNPVIREWNVSSRRLLAADRSLTSVVLGGPLNDWTQGVMVLHGASADAFRWQAAFHDGSGSLNTDFQDPPVTRTYFGLAWRGDYLVTGRRGDSNDFSAKNTREDLLIIGGGADWTQSGVGDELTGTFDVQWENTGGLGVFGALLARYTDAFRGAPGSRFDWGGLAQAGYLLTPQWELFGRYGIMLLDDDFAPGRDQIHEFTLGVNYFFGPNGSHFHRAKITVDLTYLPHGSPINSGSLGIFRGDDDQWILRGQFQFLL